MPATARSRAAIPMPAVFCRSELAREPPGTGTAWAITADEVHSYARPLKPAQYPARR